LRRKLQRKGALDQEQWEGQAPTSKGGEKRSRGQNRGACRGLELALELRFETKKLTLEKTQAANGS
jgi:hypothetical protein